MARYTVTYRCGHTAEVQLYGKDAERQRKIAWYSTIDCPDCEATKQRETAEAAGLPQLTGSERQIAWATGLRNGALDILNARIDKLPEPNKSTTTTLRDRWVGTETASSYWIDNRFDLDDLRSIVGLIQKSTDQKSTQK